MCVLRLVAALGSGILLHHQRSSQSLERCVIKRTTAHNGGLLWSAYACVCAPGENEGDVHVWEEMWEPDRMDLMEDTKMHMWNVCLVAVSSKLPNNTEHNTFWP